MPTSIKAYEKLLLVKFFKNEKTETVAAKPDDFMKALNAEGKFIMINGRGYNKASIASFGEFIPTDLENFILGFDREIQEKLRGILAEREQSGFATNGTTHLWDIYERRFVTKNA